MSTSVTPSDTARPHRLERTISLVEATRFADDLRGSLFHVLVAAVGRALGQDPGIGWSLGPGPSDPEPAVLAPSGGGQLLAVPEARTASLPEVRRVVDRLLAGSRPAERVVSRGQSAIVVAVGERPIRPEPGRAVVRLMADGEDGAASLSVRVVSDGVGLSQAEDMLDIVGRLLERPYRRLA